MNNFFIKTEINTDNEGNVNYVLYNEDDELCHK